MLSKTVYLSAFCFVSKTKSMNGRLYCGFVFAPIMIRPNLLIFQGFLKLEIVDTKFSIIISTIVCLKSELTIKNPFLQPGYSLLFVNIF